MLLLILLCNVDIMHRVYFLLQFKYVQIDLPCRGLRIVGRFSCSLLVVLFYNSTSGCRYICLTLENIIFLFPFAYPTGTQCNVSGDSPETQCLSSFPLLVLMRENIHKQNVIYLCCPLF